MSDEWVHKSSGIVLPRGTVVSTQASADELCSLDDESFRRGIREASLEQRHIKRDAHEKAQLDSLCEWLSSQGFNILGTVTYSDDYAKRYGIFSIERALKDVRLGFREIRMKNDTIKGYRGRFVICGEWHPSGRQVPHVHIVCESMGAPIPAICKDLFAFFSRTRGRSRFEPMRDVSVATLYGLKDTVKAGYKDACTMDIRLQRPRAFRGRR